MTKSKFSALSIVVPLIFARHLMNGKQFLKATSVARSRHIIVIPSFTKMSASL